MNLNNAEAMKRTIIMLVFTVMAYSYAANASVVPDSLVRQGNQAYNEARYEAAAQAYQAVLQEGYVSSELLYNLGNAYFKLNDIPSAILYYEKALKLNPKDDDINYNLSLANSRIIDKIEPLPEFFLKQWWRQVVELMPPDRWARLGIVLFILVLFFSSIFIVSRRIAVRKISFWAGIILLTLTILVMLVGWQGHQSFNDHVEGVVFTPTVTVKSSPSLNSVDLFVIHEGTKVNILDHVDGWAEIRIANGSVGWVRESDFRPI